MTKHQKVNVVAEGGELIIMKPGSDSAKRAIAIIPKNMREKVLSLMDSDIDRSEEINSIVNKLPNAAAYAKNGALYTEDEDSEEVTELSPEQQENLRLSDETREAELAADKEKYAIPDDLRSDILSGLQRGSLKTVNERLRGAVPYMENNSMEALIEEFNANEEGIYRFSAAKGVNDKGDPHLFTSIEAQASHYELSKDGEGAPLYLRHYNRTKADKSPYVDSISKEAFNEEVAMWKEGGKKPMYVQPDMKNSVLNNIPIDYDAKEGVNQYVSPTVDPNTYALGGDQDEEEVQDATYLRDMQFDTGEVPKVSNDNTTAHTDVTAGTYVTNPGEGGDKNLGTTAGQMNDEAELEAMLTNKEEVRSSQAPYDDGGYITKAAGVAISAAEAPTRAVAEGVAALKGDEHDFSRVIPKELRKMYNIKPDLEGRYISDIVGLGEVDADGIRNGRTAGAQLVNGALDMLSLGAVTKAPKLVNGALKGASAIKMKDLSNIKDFISKTLQTGKELSEKELTRVGDILQKGDKGELTKLAAEFDKGIAAAPTKVKWKPTQLEGNHPQLKSFMEDTQSPLLTRVNKKTGMVTRENINNHIKKVAKSERIAMENLLEDKFKGQTNIDYNELKSASSAYLSELKRTDSNGFLAYGTDAIGVDKKDVTTTLFGNKEKLGKGSLDHFSEESTLGHTRSFTTATDDGLNILESQSDYFQKLRHMDPEELAAEFKKYPEKELMVKEHSARLLQENMVEAVKKGKKKLRYPTAETAEKIQDYKKRTKKSYVRRNKHAAEMHEEAIVNMKTSNGDPKKIADYERKAKHYRTLQAEAEALPDTEDLVHLSNTETILKKYRDFPKMAKKIFPDNLKMYTDANGHTWYEIAAPKSYLKGNAEIKALSVALGGTAATVASSSEE